MHRRRQRRDEGNSPHHLVPSIILLHPSRICDAARSGVKPAITSRQRFATSRRFTDISAVLIIAVERASTFPTSNEWPVTPSITKSGTHPQTLLTTTGQP